MTLLQNSRDSILHLADVVGIIYLDLNLVKERGVPQVNERSREGDEDDIVWIGETLRPFGLQQPNNAEDLAINMDRLANRIRSRGREEIIVDGLTDYCNRCA